MNTVERHWQAHGLDCAVLFVHGRHRCGYVRVSNAHPWHGVDYNDPAPGEPLSEAERDERSIDDVGILAAFAYALSSEQEQAERDSAPVYRIAVHGGITYAGTLSGADLPDGWWFGFDCAHADDDPARWTLDAVSTEVERMAEQIAAVVVAA